ncbi:reverse transcriptase domain-containing protein [Tanacetum coccineum]
MGVKNVQANVDSRLVANQVNEIYIVKEADMIQYLAKARMLANGFRMFSIKQVPRSKNKKADALSKIASTSFAHLSNQVLVEELKEKSINEAEALAVVEEEEVNKARPVRRKSQRFAVVNEVLYKKSFLGPRLCMHAGTRSVVAKALRTGYYWPTMHKDARTLIRACQGYQDHRPVPRNPQQKLTPITSPWPFFKWGIDIAGPFSEGPGEGIKARLEARSKNWMEEISHVLWAHRTMIKSSNGDTPFSLTYGTEAVISAEIAIRKAKSKAKMEKYYNSKARSTSFKPGDLVYRSNDTSCAEEVGKLGPKWEVSYEVTEALGKGAYKLRDRDGNQLLRTWNIRNLKKCYVYEM